MGTSALYECSTIVDPMGVPSSKAKYSTSSDSEE